MRLLWCHRADAISTMDKLSPRQSSDLSYDLETKNVGEVVAAEMGAEATEN
jgi:hypothetical protein